MQLHHLHIPFKGKKRKRVGRGGKRGTTSGRGQKGQKSRAGRRIRPALRDLILRLPKRRGFRNKPRAPKSPVVNLGDLEGFSGVVERDALVRAGLVGPGKNREVKILGQGNIKKPLTIKGIKVSKGAKIKIEKAGGRVEP